MKKNFLLLSDFSRDELLSLLALAAELKTKRKKGENHFLLQGKTLAMIFEKSSTRTRVSFEVGIRELGGSALFLSERDIQFGRGETIEDTARVLSRYVDAIMIRTFSQETANKFAEFSSIPVINGLTDFSHPCQVLADLLTIQERMGSLDGRTLCYIGDGNNMANSLIVGGIKTGMRVRISCPTGFSPDPELMTWASNLGDFACTPDLISAAQGADVLYTDVWASMGQEAEAAQRREIFKQYQINDEVLAAAPGAMVLHCLPAHRGEEITETVFEAHAEEIFEQAENRLHAQKAIMVHLMRDSI